MNIDHSNVTISTPRTSAIFLFHFFGNSVIFFRMTPTWRYFPKINTVVMLLFDRKQYNNEQFFRIKV